MTEGEVYLLAVKEIIETLPDHSPTQEEIDEQVKSELFRTYRERKTIPNPFHAKLLTSIFEDLTRPFDDEEEDYPEVASLYREGLQFLGKHMKQQIGEREAEVLESGFKFRMLFENGEISDDDLISLMDTAKLLGDLGAIPEDILLPHHYSIFKRGIIPTYLTFNRNITRVDEVTGLTIIHETFCPVSSPLTKQRDRLLKGEGLSKIRSSKVGVLYCLEAARKAYTKTQNYNDLDDFFDV